jgi:hypothetical protein
MASQAESLLLFHDAKVLVATIAAAASIVAALISAFVSYRTARDARVAAAQLEEQKGRLSKELALENARLTQMAADRNARRDYEYDARKRLYSEIEPLLFQLYEALEEAHYRVRSVARTSRDNNLPGWLGGDGYYLSSTMYKLILPVVHYRLMQRQITFVDLRVDETIRIRYLLLKLYARSFTDDFVFASIEPSLEYDPNYNTRKSRHNSSAVYMHQGLVLGDLENICDALIIAEAEAKGRMRAVGFSEFQTRFSDPAFIDSLGELASLFTGFRPAKRPVLARMLIAQAVMAQLILSTYNQPTPVDTLHVRLESITSSKNVSRALAWEVPDVCQDLPIAHKYWQDRLKWLGTDDSWIEIE